MVIFLLRLKKYISKVYSCILKERYLSSKYYINFIMQNHQKFVLFFFPAKTILSIIKGNKIFEVTVKDMKLFFNPMLLLIEVR